MGFFGGNVNENVADLKKQIATLSELIKEQTESRINEEMAEKSLEIQEQLDSVNSELQNLRNDYSIAQVEIMDKQKSLDKVLAEKKEIEKKLKEKEVELDVKVQELNTLREERNNQRVEHQIPTTSVDLGVLSQELSQVAQSCKILEQRDDVMKNMHKELEKLQNNLYAKMLKPYKNSIVMIYDSIARTYEYYKTEAAKIEVGAYDKLIEQIKHFMLLITDTLSDEYDLDIYIPEVGALFAKGQHRVNRLIPTTDENQNNVIAKVCQCGFSYMAFDPARGAEREVYFRPAVVDVYKYNK